MSLSITMMRNAYWSAAVLIGFLAVRTVAAADQHHLSFVQYTRTDGLASNIVAGGAKDARGFLWIASPDGMQRFDGTTFHSFRYTPSEATVFRGVNYLSCFAMDSNRILFFEFSGRIDQYNYRTGRVENFSRWSGLDSIGAVSAFRDSRGRLWIATRNGLARMDGSGRLVKEFRVSSDLPNEAQDNQVNLIREDFSGRLWLAMYGKGIFLFDPASSRFSAPLKRSLHDVQVHDLSFSSDRRTVWAATGGEGVLRIDAASFRTTNITASLPAPLSAMKAVPSIHLFKDSIVWIGTLNGTMEYSIQDRTVRLHTNDPQQTASLSNNMVLFITDFGDEILWFGTLKGLNKLLGAPARFRRIFHDPHDPFSLSTNAVNHQWEDPDGNLWFATARGISIRSALTGRFHHYALTRSGDAIAIHIANDPDGNVWIGTWGGGLLRTKVRPGFVPGDPLRFEVILASQFIKRTIVDASGDILVVSWGGGILRIPKNERNASRPHVLTLRKSTVSGLSSNHIADICPVGKGMYWISTGNGLQYWDRNKGTFRTFYADSSDKEQPINRPTYIAKDPLGTVWVGTQGGLVSIDMRENELPQVHIRLRQEGLFVYQLQIDTGGTVWFGAPHSQLFEFNTRNDETRIYDLTHEMNGFEFNFGHSSAQRNSTIALCGTDGVLQFTPGTLRSVSAVPTLFRTSIMIEGTPLQGGMDHSCITRMETSFDRNSFSISFAALNFEHPERVRYEYQLEGTSGGWVPVENRTAVTFANLSPGSYRFRVRASNDNRSWSTEAMPLEILVTPPWWETTSVRFSAAVVIGLISMLVVQRKFRQLKQEQERQQHFSRQLIDSQEAERKRIASELHDGIGQNLLIISNALQMYLGAKRKKKEDIEQVTELTRETVREIRNISSNLHPHQLERLGLNRAIRSMAEHAAKTSTVRIAVTITEELKLRHPQDEIHLFRIIQETVNNILKHSGATEAEITVTTTPLHLQIMVRDNGKGFTMEDQRTDGLGMISLKERTRLLHGTLTVVSSPGAGTQLTFIIPNHG